MQIINFRINLASKEKDKLENKENINQIVNDNLIKTCIGKNICSTRVSTESNESNNENSSYNNVNNRKCKKTNLIIFIFRLYPYSSKY